MLCISVRPNEIGKSALLLPSGYNNSLTAANTNTEACLIHIPAICSLNLVLIHRSLIFVKELPDLVDIHSTLSLKLNCLLSPDSELWVVLKPAAWPMLTDGWWW